MDTLFIREIRIEGLYKIPSAVQFQRGVNIIHGPSNTGKSMVLKCIRAMFFPESMPIVKFPQGYDHVSITLENQKGQCITITRRIREPKIDKRGRKSRGKKRSTIRVTSDIPQFSTTENTLAQYTDWLPKLLGIQQNRFLYASPKGNTQPLRMRNIFSLFYLSENMISAEDSVILHPDSGASKKSTDTTILSTILFLLDGTESPIQKAIGQTAREVGKKAVAGYVKDQFQCYQRACNRIKQIFTRSGYTPESLRMAASQTAQKLHENAIAAGEAALTIQHLLSEKDRLTKEMGKAIFSREEVKALLTMYKADMDRLHFILSGRIILEETTTGDYFPAVQCEHDMLATRVAALEKLMEERIEEIHTLDEEISTTNEKIGRIRKLIQTDLKSQAKGLQQKMDQYKKLIHAVERYEVLRTLCRNYQRKLSKENLPEPDILKWDARAEWQKRNFSDFVQIFQEAVNTCASPHTPGSVDIDPRSMDAIINGEPKASQGEGYRALLNTLLAFSLAKYLETCGRHTCPFLLLDSPIMSMKENEEQGDPLQTHLLQYLIDHAGSTQIIIADNDLPRGMDTTRCHMIHFCKDKKQGRYGFLMDPPGKGDPTLFNQ